MDRKLHHRMILFFNIYSWTDYFFGFTRMKNVTPYRRDCINQWIDGNPKNTNASKATPSCPDCRNVFNKDDLVKPIRLGLKSNCQKY